MTSDLSLMISAAANLFTGSLTICVWVGLAVLGGTVVRQRSPDASMWIMGGALLALLTAVLRLVVGMSSSLLYSLMSFEMAGLLSTLIWTVLSLVSIASLIALAVGIYRLARPRHDDMGEVLDR